MRALLSYVVRRLLSIAAVMVGVAALVFSVFHALRPDLFAFDTRPFAVELGDYLQGVFLRGDFGSSWDRLQGRRPVADMLEEGFPASLALLAGGLAVGTTAGIALGAAAAGRPRSVVARAVSVFSAFAVAAPVYWVGLMVVVFFHPEVGQLVALPISRPNTYEPLTADPLTWLHALAVPWVVLALPLAGACARMMRASLVETLDEDFVRTAHGKGLSRRRVLRRHAVPAASVPVISLVGVSTGTLVTNAMLLESVFGVPGIFGLATQALGTTDLPVIAGVAIAGAFLVVTANLLADVAQAWLDPRVREG